MTWRRYASLPILWLYLGPPILRPVSERGAMESLAGVFDAWNIFRLAWWMLFALIALVSIYQHRQHVREFIRTMPQLVLWVFVWVSSLIVSSAFSPAPLFTLANAGLMLMLVVAGFDLGLRIFARTVDLETVLRGLYVVSVGLLAMIVVNIFLDPGSLLGVRGLGFRIGGGFIGDTALLASVVIFLSLYFLMRVRGSKAVWYAIATIASLAILVMTRTRTAYIGLALGGGLFAFQWLLLVAPRARAIALGAILIAAGLVPPAIVAADALTGTSSINQMAQYLVRDATTVATASGRTTITAIVIEQVASQPWGLGYSAGPRLLLQSSYSELGEHGVHAERIGNAHNTFLEMLGGSGVLGLFAYLAFLTWVALNMLRVSDRGMLPVRALFIYVVVAGLTSSNGVLPFFQASVLTWFVLGAVAGANGVLHAMPSRAPRAVPRPPALEMVR